MKNNRFYARLTKNTRLALFLPEFVADFCAKQSWQCGLMGFSKDYKNDLA
jgi:hypothetical protein